MKLELAVSRALMWARVIESALHDPGPWTFRTATGTTPAHRLVDREGAEIVFTGIALPSPDGLVELCSGGAMVSLAETDFSKGDRVHWRLSLKEPAPAS